MADANITKHALAEAMKGLMAEMPFDKITITHICDRCDMNRKSFYYHFQDKYALVNWIFDTEVSALIQQEAVKFSQIKHLDSSLSAQYIHTLSLSSDDYRMELDVFCHYFYQNRGFYRPALQIKGQNSFLDHFREFLHPIFKFRIETLLKQHGCPPMKNQYITFYTETLSDTFINALERWLQKKDCMPPEEFVNMLFTLINNVSYALCRELSADYGQESAEFCSACRQPY